MTTGNAISSVFTAVNSTVTGLPTGVILMVTGIAILSLVLKLRGK